MGESLVKTSLLPSLVELASDDNMAVRSAAVASAVLMIPYLNKRGYTRTSPKIGWALSCWCAVVKFLSFSLPLN